ncbi:hypothetical protein ABID58_000817 [Bradyrhizobium sp. S3.2.6]|uniref:hypothetical protein n=1 Tax=Bradyrhizobium sp. S3.2.6 TaxID=3156428 RepID=UPI003391EA6E
MSVELPAAHHVFKADHGASARDWLFPRTKDYGFFAAVKMCVHRPQAGRTPEAAPVR